MEMLLRHLGMHDLALMFERHRGLSPAPHLRDPEAIARAARLAGKNPVRAELDALDPARVIPAGRRSHYREYQRSGDRRLPQEGPAGRRAELDRAALALWLGHPKGDRDFLQDLMWACCDDWTWVMAAHEPLAVDLGSAMMGAKLAEILHALGDRLEEEVRERVTRTIEERLFAPFWDYRRLHWWKTGHNNWNHVCNGCFIQAALYLVDDPPLLAHMIHAAVQNMTYALDGFSDDGGCREGPGYWGYGFGHYLLAAHALFRRTGGELNIMADDTGKIARICRYPLAAHIEGPLRATFSDSSHGWLPAQAPLLINDFYDMPELFPLCETNPDRTLRVGTMGALALYDGFKVRATRDDGDYFLPDLGLAKLRSAPGAKQLTLLCLAGDNGVPHNHNDIGSFIVHRGGRVLLDDPGGPVYRRETFGPDRYDILFCGAQGHSVPVINGTMQQAGARYSATLRLETPAREDRKQAVIDMSRAYPEGTVRELTRTFTLDTRKHELILEDAFAFDNDPRAIREQFITCENARVKDGAVLVGPAKAGVTLGAENCAGRFSVERLAGESRAGRTGRVVSRISFVPEKLARRLKLRFRIS